MQLLTVAIALAHLFRIETPGEKSLAYPKTTPSPARPKNHCLQRLNSANEAMVSRLIVHRIVACISAFIVLTVASSHLLCGSHAVHADERQSVSLSHEHVLCECEGCQCELRETALAVQANGIDEIDFQPVALVADWRHEELASKFSPTTRWQIPSNEVASQHLLFHKATVILI